jgi:ribonuclease HI
LSLARLPSFVILATLWLKHSILELIRKDRRSGRSRERIYVDASYTAPESTKGQGVGGIGVWIPKRGIAIALKVEAKSSMEAEILALVAGAIVAKRLKAQRPVIFSDCKSAVRTATRLMSLGRAPGLTRKLGRIAELSSEHRAFRHVYDAMRSQHGTLEWQPRENNREADLASSIGSRLGNMGILLAGSKNRNHALNDVLSRAGAADALEAATGDLVRRRYRCGTETVSLRSQRSTSSRAFPRAARHLIARLSAEVA